MRPIDRFVAALRRGEGEELIFQAGAPIRIRSGADVRVLLAQPIRSDQIQTILADVVPAEIDQGFLSDGDASFTIEAGGAPVLVFVRRYQGRLDAVLRTSPVPERAPPPTLEPPISVEKEREKEKEKKAREHDKKEKEKTAKENTAAAKSGEEGKAAEKTRRPEPPYEEDDTPEREILSRTHTPVVTALVGGRKQIDVLLHALVQNKASDLHLTAGLSPRMRKDGDIVPIPGFPELQGEAIRAMLLELAPLTAREKFEKTNDADYAYEIPGLARFRVNAFKDRRGYGGVLRVIPSKILSADELSLPQVVRDLCSLHKGLVLVTGPTGSGKSTTLAAMIDLINSTRSDHIITIEDPVEFVHETKACLVNQREVHADTQSFAVALRAALREDPDIVLVGELRDLETVAIAIETAETGHLVFGTLHTTTAVGTVDRIIDQFPTDRQTQIRMMLSESLKGVIAQTLCKKNGGGRVAALEILVCNTAVANLIREGKTFQLPSLMQTQKQIGMQTLNDALLHLVKEGVVAPEEAMRKAVDRGSFKMILDKAQIKLG